MSVRGRFAGIAPRPVFLPAVRPKTRCIMADIDQRYSCVNAWVVLLVKMQLALCPFFVDRPRCSASGPVWLRKTVMPRYSSWLVLAVFPSVVDSSERQVPVRDRVRIRVFGQGLRLSRRGSGACVHCRAHSCADTAYGQGLRTGPDALHHGRYGPEVLVHGRSHACCVQRHMPMVQTAYNCGVSAVPVLFVHRHPCRGADPDSYGPSPQSFPSCSSLIRWSTFAAHVVACPLCATTDALVDDVAQFIDSLNVPVSMLRRELDGGFRALCTGTGPG